MNQKIELELKRINQFYVEEKEAEMYLVHNLDSYLLLLLQFEHIYDFNNMDLLVLIVQTIQQIEIEFMDCVQRLVDNLNKE